MTGTPSRKGLGEIYRSGKSLQSTKKQGCDWLPAAYWLLGEQAKARRDLERARQLEPRRPRWQERFREFDAMF